MALVQPLPKEWNEASPLLTEKLNIVSRDIDKIYDSLVVKYKEGIERVNDNLIEQESRHQKMIDGLNKKVDKGFSCLNIEISKLHELSRSNKEQLERYTSERKLAKTIISACIYAIPQIFMISITFLTFYFTILKPITDRINQ